MHIQLLAIYYIVLLSLTLNLNNINHTTKIRWNRYFGKCIHNQTDWESAKLNIQLNRYAFRRRWPFRNASLEIRKEKCVDGINWLNLFKVKLREFKMFAVVVVVDVFNCRSVLFSYCSFDANKSIVMLSVFAWLSWLISWVFLFPFYHYFVLFLFIVIHCLKIPKNLLWSLPKIPKDNFLPKKYQKKIIK